MPLINIETSTKISDKNEFMKKSSSLIASITGKSENFVMVKVNDEVSMYFAGDSSPTCYVQLKSIGSINPPRMSKSICEFINIELGIPFDRIYINFQDIKPSEWGWKMTTFG